MAASAQSSNYARFRPATEFPRNVQTLEREEANALYEEMRACLVFTNRSRGQLIRRNEEHKEKALALRSQVNHLQELINRLQNQKTAEILEREALIKQLAREMQAMDFQLSSLSDAFDAVGDIEAEAQSQWGRILFPKRILELLKAVKALMQWYRRDYDSTLPDSPVEVTSIDEVDRRDHPHRYSDQASINRDLLDR